LGMNRPPRQMYFAFDLIASQGCSYAQEPFQTRFFKLLIPLFDIGHDQDVLFDPRKWLETATELASQGKIVCEGNQFCLMFRVKNFMPLHSVDTVWRKRTSLKHKSDGLIFVPMEERLHVGTDMTQFKWKPVPTIDLEFTGKVNPDTNLWDFEFFYFDKGQKCSGSIDGICIPKDKVLTELYTQDKIPLVLNPTEYSQTIVQWNIDRGRTQFSYITECSCKLPNVKEWLDVMPLLECTIVKLRHDKNRPNDKFTIERTLNNVYENITIKEISDVANHQ